MTASECKIRAVSATSDKPRTGGVVTLPAFDSYGDTILEWLSAIGNGEPAPGTVLRVANSMQHAVIQIERVRDSARHRNLAVFLRHSLIALRASEWEGARYVLLTAFATLSARPLPEVKDANRCEPAGIVLQFPAEAITGTVTG